MNDSLEAHAVSYAHELEEMIRQKNAEIKRLRTTLSLLLDEIDSEYDNISPGIWRAYSRAVEVLGKPKEHIKTY